MIGLLLLVAGIFYLNSMTTQSPNMFSLHPKADFYVISYGDIRGYSLTGQTLKQLSKDRVQLVKGQINRNIHRAEIKRRYLLFSEEGPPLGVVGRIIAMDFKTGNITYNQTPDYAYTSAGASSDYYFTSTATTEDTFLASFDSRLKQRSKYTFKEPVIGSDFSVDGTALYFVGTKVHGEDGDYPTDLYQLSSEHGKIQLKSVERLYDHPDKDKTYFFADNIVKNRHLYNLIDGYRNHLTKEKEMLIYDMQTRQKKLIDLPEVSPASIFDLGQDRMAIGHETSEIGKVGFSLLDLKNQTVRFIDLTPFGLSVEKEDDVKDMKRLTDDLLLILSGSQLIVYNISTNQVVLQEKEMHPDSFHIWLTHQS